MRDPFQSDPTGAVRASQRGRQQAFWLPMRRKPAGDVDRLNACTGRREHRLRWQISDERKTGAPREGHPQFLLREPLNRTRSLVSLLKNRSIACIELLGHRRPSSFAETWNTAVPHGRRKKCLFASSRMRPRLILFLRSSDLGLTDPAPTRSGESRYAWNQRQVTR